MRRFAWLQVTKQARANQSRPWLPVRKSALMQRNRGEIGEIGGTPDIPGKSGAPPTFPDFFLIPSYQITYHRFFWASPDLAAFFSKNI